LHRELLSDDLRCNSPDSGCDASQSEVLQIIRKYGLFAVPVVTQDYELPGIVTYDDIL